jgi:glycosyltransferase involved in cell wall biosynthesis
VTSRARVLIVGGFAGSLVNFRGDLIQALLARGATVHAAAPVLSSESEEGRTLRGWGAIPHAVPLARTSQNPVRDLHTALSLYRLCRRLAPSHVLAYTVKPVLYGMPAARLAGVERTMALITGLGYSFSPEHGTLRQRYTQALVQTLYSGALKTVDCVVFQNVDDLELFVSLGLVPRARTAVVSGSGVNLVRFPSTPLPPLDGELHFLLIGRLIAHKGIREFIEAARRVRACVPHARFHLAGMHDENPSSIPPTEVKRWVANGIVTYHGELRDVRPVLARCHVYVLPSYREGVPRTVLEAMAMGRAIITTDAPGCRETVAHGETGFLVPVRDVDALVAAMLRLIEDPALIARFGAASRQRVEQLFDVHQVNQQLMGCMGIGGAGAASGHTLGPSPAA